MVMLCDSQGAVVPVDSNTRPSLDSAVEVGTNCSFNCRSPR